MRIKRLDLSGFKSFCDPVRITLDSAVTAVVGPNGCGKSNIVDALRWTLGEASPKALRGAAMEDVIFNGSESRGPKSMAEVTITFDNTDGLSHASYIDSTEVAVTRRLHRDGTSEYLINKVPCRRKDITDLFLGTGGGARAYSIVEQGRIGLIVSARTEDRRNMIEEAAGITKYKTARRISERRMDQTRQNLLRVSDVVAEMERNLGNLSRQAKKAERYKRYREEQTDLELHLASYHYLRLRAETMSLHALFVEKEALLENARHALAASETRVDQLKLEEHGARSRLDEETARVYEIDNQIKVAETEIRHLLETIERHSQEEETTAGQLAQSSRQKTQLEEERQLIEEQLKRVAEDRERAGIRYQEIQAELEAARDGLATLAEDHDIKRDEVSRSRSLLAAAETAAVTLGRRIEEIENRLLGVRRERDTLAQQAEALRIKSEELLHTTTEVETRLSEARISEEHERNAYGLLKEEVERLDADLRQVRDELKGKMSRKESLEEVMDGLESHDSAVRDAVKMLEETGEDLLNGLLLDTIAAEERFEPAVAAAFGDRLQALLVKDRASGLRILGMLKDRDMGRVAVVVPDYHLKIESAPPIVDDPRVLGPLAQFLRADTSVRDLVEGITKDIFLVSTLAEAEALFEVHNGQVAFVTLDGQLLEAGGVMRGGRSKTTGAQLLGQRREIRKLAAEVAALETKHAALDERFAAVKEELRATGMASETARTAVQAEAIALAEVKKDNARTSDDLMAMARRKEGMDREIAHQEEMLAQARSDRDHATQEETRLKRDIEAMQQALHARSGEIEACRKEVDRLNAASADIRVRKAGLDQQWQSGFERLDQLKQMKRELDERLSMTEERRRAGWAALGKATGTVFLKREQMAERLVASEEARARAETLRRAMDEASVLVVEAEQAVKSERTDIDGIAHMVSDLEMKKRETFLEIGHLLEQVEERNDCDLLRVLSDYHMREEPGAEARARIDELKGVIDRMGPINLAAIDQYVEQKARYEQLAAQKIDLEQALEDLERAITKMDRDSKRRFRETFDDVAQRFQEIFPKLFKGGVGRLELTDPNDLLTSGVEIIAQPPGKKLGSNELLSGGEKALTAVSLLFAIFLHRPSPFCVLDEVDAPLDEANIHRLVDMVHQMTDRSQFIMVTHSKITMEKSDALFGITMEEPGISKLVSVKLTNTRWEKKNDEAYRAPEISAGA